MKIIADKNTPLVAEAFKDFGEVIPLETSGITRDAVRQADILIVRSEVKVNEALLDGSRVRFVGSVTIGTDHVDLNYLHTRGIKFANAPGCNANSVKEYVVAALLSYAVRRQISLRGRTLGVVGVGHIGSKVVHAAETLGMTVFQNDPPLKRQTGEARFAPLETLLDADFITLHVPLTREGPDRTFHLLEERLFERLRKNVVLINTSRGPVIDTAALKRAVTRGLDAVLLDVWENEPAIDLEALSLATIATAHIAGYSMDGKVNAVRLVRQAVCRYLGISSEWEAAPLLQPPPRPVITLEAPGLADEEALHAVVRQAYDIEQDDARLRAVVKQAPELRGPYFQGLRTGYACRREFSSFRVHVSSEYSHLLPGLGALGFESHVLNPRSR